MPVLERLSGEELLERAQNALGDRAINLQVRYGHLDFFCRPQNLVEVMTTLREDPNLECRFFTFLSAVDRSEFADEPGGLEVLIHVYSPDKAIHANVRVPVDAENPVCPSISEIYKGALWHERETWEMFGIDFEGHPALTKLYLPEDFEGHPLRKSFKLPSRALVKEWPGAKDPEEAAAGGR